jgi:hypothetical protein
MSDRVTYAQKAAVSSATARSDSGKEAAASSGNRALPRGARDASLSLIELVSCSRRPLAASKELIEVTLLLIVLVYFGDETVDNGDERVIGVIMALSQPSHP